MKANLNRIIDGTILSVLFLTIFVYAIFGVQWFFNNSLREPTQEVFLGSISCAPTDIIIPEGEIFSEVNADSVISVESDLKNINKIIFSKDSDKKLPIASLTKLMTAIIVLDNYNLSDTFLVSTRADSMAPIEHDVKAGDVMTVKNFLYIMLVGSSNRSAYTLSELAGEQKFVELMNKKAEELGMKDTLFADPTGLHPQNISTANDLANLAIYILKDYPGIAEMSRIKELYIPGFGNVVNTDELLDEIPNIVCSKTGFTKIAKGCLLLVVNNPKNNDYLINVILGADNRFFEMKKLINFSSKICQ